MKNILQSFVFHFTGDPNHSKQSLLHTRPVALYSWHKYRILFYFEVQPLKAGNQFSLSSKQKLDLSSNL